MSETIPYEKYLTVSALNHYVSRKFDQDPYLETVFLVGEISNFRHREGGHQYFSLKDDKSVISAVMYKSYFQRVPFKVEQGMKVYVTGTVQVYPPHGTYQISIKTMEPDGIGSLYLQLEQLKEKLRKLGWFDRLHRPIERFPKHIAVVTSPTGAVIHDILTTVKRRYNIAQVTVFPAIVQGKQSAPSVVSALKQIDQRHEEFDTIIIARGGGSLEDLWSFNEGSVAQAILESKIPVISSIGHETDTTIADLVADHRAPTPTAAAEFATPLLLTDIMMGLNVYQNRMTQAMTQRIRHIHRQLDPLVKAAVFTRPERLYQPFMQRVDQLKERMERAMETVLRSYRYRYQMVNQQLANKNPGQKIHDTKRQVQQSQHDLIRAVQQIVRDKRQQFTTCVQMLNAHSPLNILERGYALVESNGEVIASVHAVKKDTSLTVRMHDGQIEAKVTRVISEERSKDDTDQL